MLFGSDEMKDLLKTGYTNPKLHKTVMDELYNSVVSYTQSKLKENFKENEIGKGFPRLETQDISYHDKEEIAHEVFIAVKTRLDSFIANADRYTEAQRQAWLRKIIYVSVVKYFERHRRETMGGKVIPLQDYTQGSHTPADDVERFLRYEQMVKNVVEVACSAPSKPEKILAYLYNSLIFKELLSRVHNSSSKLTAGFMNGKLLFDLKETMKNSVGKLFGVRLVSGETEPLEASLGRTAPTPKGNEECSVTPKIVSDWSNRIKAYILEHKKDV